MNAVGRVPVDETIAKAATGAEARGRLPGLQV
jgi:hypothetical protein